MHPKGLIYLKGKSANVGEARIALPVSTRLIYHLIRSTGAGIIAFVVIVFLFSFYPILSQEVSYSLNKKIGEGIITDTVKVDLAEADRVIAVQKEADSYGINSYFSVAVPKINAYSNIIANVDTNNRDEYTKSLQNGVAHAKGTYFPGQGQDIFLFAHSTDSPVNIARYNAVFYLLRKLEKGDKILIYFADRKYLYEVEEKRLTDANDTSWITSTSGTERLLLMTCDPPGTTWRRLIVIAKPVFSS